LVGCGKPLARYWLDPYCTEPDHLTNYSPGYLQLLGVGIAGLKDNLHDTLLTLQTSDFGVMYLNKILGIGPSKLELPIEGVRKLAVTWGSDLVPRLTQLTQ
jgi:hypothetical protein